ncbi:MAG: dTDP-3-amino-3,4,6-trideoxy-alpha-D-glucose transaminase [Candidatus Nitrospira kreftii]|uniref:dTDP-3-amino-3,4,6-trideoxy-alpha-D-glucose transaminase n=1 Tax=Candidatus Nitrospira kreftii TaxID=2652173 RepID=A0A7S8J016_9BACT|nr:MAG: dTDP-3-amino-3,4,6-trideoxy-alpha-D-glucose transaminase [Candidatus Nitrospira kreftii]
MENMATDIGSQQPRPSTIQVADPGADARSDSEVILAAIERVLCGGHYILGQEVECFEKEWAEYLGVSYCVGVASGTDALALALRATGVLPGDEVVTVSHTAVATIAAIEAIGAVPVFVDIDSRSRCMDPNLLREAMTPRSRAIVPVHIYGQPAAMEQILCVARQYRCFVIEDSAQAHGAAIGGRKVGTFGDAAAFSFYPTKNLGAIGDAGAVVSNDAAIDARLRSLRQYGWRERYVSDQVGINSRLDEVQAAILRVKLRHLDRRNQKRRTIAARYRAALAGTGAVAPRDIPDTTHAMHLFVLESRMRSSLAGHLSEAGIATALHYPIPVHRQPAYVGRIAGADRLPVTEALYERLLTIPCHPDLTDEQVQVVCEQLQTWSEATSLVMQPAFHRSEGTLS